MTKLYWWNKRKNFGDSLGQLLLERFSHITSEWASPDKADIAIVGSILEHLPDQFKGIIAGCGKLHERTKLNLSTARVLGLRGHLTAKGINGSYVIADPGLLADELVPIEDKEWNLGIVPHLTDTKLEHTPVFQQFKPKIIRVSDDPLKVISEISRCKKIVSSSLHGIILADAFAIPRRIEIAPMALSHPNLEGGLFKWMDYCSSIGMKLTVGLTQEADQRIISEKQSELYDMFTEIESILRA